ncbi:MAG: hypothetical protein R3B71_02190 [Candidatus Gracilibacteria bacterium]
MLAAERIESERAHIGNSEIETILRNVLWDREGPRRITNEEADNRKNILIMDKLFLPFSEIATSYDSIQNISIYIGVFPFKKKTSIVV